jgi:hypothetical protein
LVNGEVQLALEVSQASTQSTKLQLRSNIPFQQARMELLDQQQKTLQAYNIGRLESTQMNEASISLTAPLAQASALRFAVTISGTHYYAETSTLFLKSPQG